VRHRGEGRARRRARVDTRAPIMYVF